MGLLRRIADRFDPPSAPAVPARDYGRSLAMRRVHLGDIRRSASDYDAAETTRLNEKHWANASLTDADSALLTNLETIRNRCRYELRNGGYAKGMQRDFARDFIGIHGPALSVVVLPPPGADDDQDDDPPYDPFPDAVETDWYDWAYQLDEAGLSRCETTGKMVLSDTLKLSVKSYFDSGEFFIQLVTDQSAEGPVKLRLNAIEADRIATPISIWSDTSVKNGIKVSKDGRPIEYYVLRRHPGDTLNYAYPTEYDVVPAKDMIHVYDVERPGQTHGDPWMSPINEHFAHLRCFIRDTLLSARVAAHFSGFIYTDHPNAEMDTIGGELPVFDTEPCTVSTLPQGWKFAQARPEQPATSFRDFKREMLAEMGRPIGMPYLRVGMDAAGHNYSSARMDDLPYVRTINERRAGIERHVLNRIFMAWYREWRLSLGSQRRLVRIPPAWDYSWTWEAIPSVDPEKEATSQQVRLESGLSSPQREAKANGQDWESILQDWKRYVTKATKMGLAFLIPQRKPVSAPSPKPKTDEDEPAVPAPAGKAKGKTDADEAA